MEYKWTALTVTTVGTLMAGIDARIVVVGLPTVAQQLHASPDQLVWVTQAYILAGTVGLFLIGRIGDVFGRVKLYNLGFAIFAVGSVFCALAQSPNELIAFRIIQGVGSGVVISMGATIVTDAAPKNELGTMLGVNQGAFRVGNVTGLTVAGIVLTLADWRGLFYINIPVGIFATFWAHRRLKEVVKSEPSKKMDWTGFGCFSLGLTSILLAITFLSYGSSSLEGYSLLVAGVALIVVFVKLEGRVGSPLLDLRLFRIRTFAAGNLAQILNSLSWYGMILLMAFYLQLGLGYTPLQAGLGIAPLDGTYLASSLISGRLSDKYGTRGLATLGLVINTISYFAISSFGSSTPYPWVALTLFCVGIGNGMFNTPNARAIMGSVPASRRGIASGFRSTMFQVGSTISYGLVILLITLGIPYPLLSQLLQGAFAPGTALMARSQFMDGFRIATVAIAVIDAVAIIPSAMRGTRDAEVGSPSQE